MKLHELSPNPGSRQRRKRVGRGDSSGLGKTAGRGEKGQKSRTGAKIRPFFEGGQIPLFRRLPKRGFKNADRIIYTLVNLNILEENFNAGDVVDVAALQEKNLIGKKFFALKIGKRGLLVGPVKGKTVGIKRLIFIAPALICSVRAVFSVTDERVTDMREMRADLVRSARHQLDIKQGIATSLTDHLIFSDDIFTTR